MPVAVGDLVGRAREIGKAHDALADQRAARVDSRQVVVPGREPRVDHRDTDAGASEVEPGRCNSLSVTAAVACARRQQGADRPIQMHSGDAVGGRECLQGVVRDFSDVAVDQGKPLAGLAAVRANLRGQVGRAGGAHNHARDARLSRACRQSGVEPRLASGRKRGP